MTETSFADTLPNLQSAVSLKEILTHQIIHADFYIKPIRELPALETDQVLVPIEDIGKYPMPKIMVEFLKKAELSNEQH